MKIDFSTLGGSDASDTIIAPRDLFSVLPGKKRARYLYPRDVQADVWAQWFARRNERDLTIKMNTGGGKTVVGLVVLKSCLNENVGPAMYVAPSPALVRQVIAEAGDLGIETTEDPISVRYSSGKAILVVNIYKLINGRSVFGVCDQGARIPIGAVVIDDAHACLAASEDQFALRLTSPHPAYAELLKLFYPSLEKQSVAGAMEVKDGDPHKNMIVPYWSWINKQDKVLAILHQQRSSDALMFTYPLLKDCLTLCECVFGASEVEITPRCLPIANIPSFATAGRRIFMSATFGDDSVLVTHFDAAPESVRVPITPENSGDIGDRMILIPQQLNPRFTREELKNYFVKCAAGVNVVVLVPSDHHAEFWADVAVETLRANNLSEGIARLRAGHVGLIVLVNKYDGLDLPEDACRILVIEGLPDVRSRLDKVEQGLLLGSEEVVRNSIQRVEQGMGRGIRSNDDHCAVFLVGSTLTSQLYARNAKKFFTPATRAQLELSEKLAQQLQGPTIAQMHASVELFLARDDGWIRASKAAVVGAAKPGSAASLKPFALAQRQAFNSASRGDFVQACADMQPVVDSEKDGRVKGWLLWQLAEYQHRIDATKSQQILKEATRLNSQLVRPIDGIDYVRIPGQLATQARLCLERLREKYLNPNTFLIDMNAYLDELVFQPDTAEQFERALAELAWLLGFTGQQPEREFGRGPDVLWSLGQQQFFVIECKNGATVETISKGYCNQLTGSMTWFESNYGKTCKGVPLMIHPAAIVEYAGTMHSAARLVRVEQLDALRTALRNFAMSIASKVKFGTEAEVANALQQQKLTAAQFESAYTVKPRRKM